MSEGPTPARKRLLYTLVHEVQVQGRDAIFPVFRVPGGHARAPDRGVRTMYGLVTTAGRRPDPRNPDSPAGSGNADATGPATTGTAVADLRSRFSAPGRSRRHGAVAHRAAHSSTWTARGSRRSAQPTAHAAALRGQAPGDGSAGHRRSDELSARGSASPPDVGQEASCPGGWADRAAALSSQLHGRPSPMDMTGAWKPSVRALVGGR